MKRIVVATAVAITFAQALVGTAAADAGIRQEKVQFVKGASSAVIEGQSKGDPTVDYVVRAAARPNLVRRAAEIQRTELFQRVATRFDGQCHVRR